MSEKLHKIDKEPQSHRKGFRVAISTGVLTAMGIGASAIFINVKTKTDITELVNTASKDSKTILHDAKVIRTYNETGMADCFTYYNSSTLRPIKNSIDLSNIPIQPDNCLSIIKTMKSEETAYKAISDAEHTVTQDYADKDAYTFGLPIGAEIMLGGVAFGVRSVYRAVRSAYRDRKNKNSSLS